MLGVCFQAGQGQVREAGDHDGAERVGPLDLLACHLRLRLPPVHLCHSGSDHDLPGLQHETLHTGMVWGGGSVLS